MLRSLLCFQPLPHTCSGLSTLTCARRLWDMYLSRTVAKDGEDVYEIMDMPVVRMQRCETKRCDPHGVCARRCTLIVRGAARSRTDGINLCVAPLYAIVCHITVRQCTQNASRLAWAAAQSARRDALRARSRTCVKGRCGAMLASGESLRAGTRAACAHGDVGNNVCRSAVCGGTLFPEGRHRTRHARGLAAMTGALAEEKRTSGGLGLALMHPPARRVWRGCARRDLCATAGVFERKDGAAIRAACAFGNAGDAAVSYDSYLAVVRPEDGNFRLTRWIRWFRCQYLRFSSMGFCRFAAADREPLVLPRCLGLDSDCWCSCGDSTFLSIDHNLSVSGIFGKKERALIWNQTKTLGLTTRIYSKESPVRWSGNKLE
ncbi:hypothetical protein C8R44DRAFT_751448 [Mycena epipterygia]|nr:hypothetical protein C8R44DRAFT_751448 [Mycena epipterygia]